MEFFELEKIYKFYKNEIKIVKLLYENKRFMLLITCLLFIGWIVLYFIWAINKYYNYLYLGIVIYLLSLVFAFFLGVDTVKVLREKYDIKIKKNLDEALVIARSNIFLEYLYEGEYRFKLKKQKEVLITIFEEASQSNKVNSFWITGIVVSLLIPLWVAFINLSLNSNKSPDVVQIFVQLLGIIMFILALISFAKFSLFDMILNFRNRRSKAFREMAYIIRNDLLFNEYSKESSLKGELSIKKIY
ncbi:hypothetical protein [Clostridium estertheticum]|uniref:hypothetical protein n=1 Tax=Clostridium estertheticum TaxID=238834 RepID=UPI001C7CA436|nr:hypothetical protein [Clostridium estertheticum]MBX4270336.1 hypothetical protein [Clostridium estertheticum]WLC80875.1 hypothetical protein KTC98_06465 [Clostridium estertheticum]